VAGVDSNPNACSNDQQQDQDRDHVYLFVLNVYLFVLNEQDRAAEPSRSPNSVMLESTASTV